MFCIILYILFKFALSFNVELQEHSSIKSQTYRQSGTTGSSYFGFEFKFRSEDNETVNLIIASPKPRKADEPNFHMCQISSNNSLSLVGPNCTKIRSPSTGTNSTLLGLTFSIHEEEGITACYPSKTLDCNPQTRIVPGFCFITKDDGKIWKNLSNSRNEYCRIDSTLDLIFLLDGSGSVSQGNFNIVKNWVKGVSTHFDISERYTQIGIIEFSSYFNDRPLNNQPYIKTEIELGSIHNQTIFNNSVDRIPFYSGGTFTSKALNKSVLEFQTSRRFSNYNNSKVLVVVTDGKATDPQYLDSTVNYLKSLGIKIFAIGVGNVDQEELRLIASSTNTDSNVFFVDNFDALDGIANQVQERIFNFALEGTNSAAATTFKLELGEQGFSLKTTVRTFGALEDLRMK